MTKLQQLLMKALWPDR